MDVSALLDAWGMSSLEDCLKDNEIDICALRLMSEEDLRLLIKPMGTLIKFRACWKAWLAEENAKKSTDQEAIAELQAEESEAVDPKAAEPKAAETEAAELEAAGSEIVNLDGVLNFLDCGEEIQLLTQISNGGEGSSSEQFFTIPSNFVLQILGSSVDGRALLQIGRHKEGLLGQSQRKEVARLIVNHILGADPNTQISANLFTKISLQVKQLFDKESEKVLLSPFHPGTLYQRKKKRQWPFLLYEAYVTRRRKLRKLGVIQGGRSRSRSDVRPPTSSKLDEEGFEEQLSWLGTSIEPFSLVHEYWEDTFTIRQSSLDRDNSVATYFDKFPILKTQIGFNLLVEDFERIYPEAGKKLFSSIVLLREKLIELAAEKRTQSRDNLFKSQIGELIASAGDGNNLATLLILPYLLTVPTIKSKGKPTWKPSRTEVRDAFVTLVPSVADVLPAVEARKEKYIPLERTFQPTVFVVGPNISDTVKSLVVINNTTYFFDTPIEAIDAAFKIYHSTGACYPEEATEVWLFVQRAFYQIVTKFDRMSQTIRHLMTNVGHEV